MMAGSLTSIEKGQARRVVRQPRACGEVDPQHRPVVQLGGVEVLAFQEQLAELLPGQDIAGPEPQGRR
jgi:hypothetical protein